MVRRISMPLKRVHRKGVGFKIYKITWKISPVQFSRNKEFCLKGLLIMKELYQAEILHLRSKGKDEDTWGTDKIYKTEKYPIEEMTTAFVVHFRTLISPKRLSVHGNYQNVMKPLTP